MTAKPNEEKKLEDLEVKVLKRSANGVQSPRNSEPGWSKKSVKRVQSLNWAAWSQELKWATKKWATKKWATKTDNNIETDQK